MQSEIQLELRSTTGALQALIDIEVQPQANLQSILEYLADQGVLHCQPAEAVFTHQGKIVPGNKTLSELVANSPSRSLSLCIQVKEFLSRGISKASSAEGGRPSSKISQPPPQAGNIDFSDLDLETSGDNILQGNVPPAIPPPSSIPKKPVVPQQLPPLQQPNYSTLLINIKLIVNDPTQNSFELNIPNIPAISTFEDLEERVVNAINSSGKSSEKWVYEKNTLLVYIGAHSMRKFTKRTIKFSAITGLIKENQVTFTITQEYPGGC